LSPTLFFFVRGALRISRFLFTLFTFVRVAL
jgi:hypothetical protein